MKALEILKRCRAAKDDIEQLDQRIRQRWDVLTSLGAPQADPNGGSRGRGDMDKYGRIYGDIDELERQKEARKDAWRAEASAAPKILEDCLPSLEGEILHNYYVKRMNTTEIARAKKYTVGYVRKVKRAAENLLDMLSEEKVNQYLPDWYVREGKGRK